MSFAPINRRRPIFDFEVPGRQPEENQWDISTTGPTNPTSEYARWQKRVNQPLPPSSGPYNPKGGVRTEPNLEIPPYGIGGVPANTFPPGQFGATPPQQSIIQMLMGNRSPEAQGWADVASTAGAFSSGEKANRIVRGNYTQDYDQMMLDRERDMNEIGRLSQSDYDNLMLRAQAGQRDAEASALRQLPVASYLASGGAKPSAPVNLGIAGKQYTVPSFGQVAPATESEMAGGSALQKTLVGRLGGEGFHMPTKFDPKFDYQPHPLSGYINPGTMERVGDYAALGTGIMGGLTQAFGGGNPLGGGQNGPGSFIGDLMSKGLGKIPGIGRFFGGGGASNVLQSSRVPGAMGSAMGNAGSFLGKAVPLAGAATGIAGLMKDRGFGSNVMSGVGAGAGIGSVVPGIGTAIGAGIGGLVGALRGIGGGPSEAEKAGREVAGSGRQALASIATPEQMQEAQAAGWDNPQDAQAFIVIRDALINRGGNPAQADQLMRQLWEAEKQGPEAVQAAMAQIAKVTGMG